MANLAALAGAWLMVLCAGATRGGEDDLAELPPPAGRKVDFTRDVRPLLAAFCLKCHGPTKQESNYRLDLRMTAFKGGDFEQPPILPGRSADSPLIRYVAGTDPDVTMPPEGKRLSREQVSILRAWIDQGADWPQDSDATIARITTDHWSFQPLVRPEPPEVNDDWAAGPLDAFILARLHAAGLSPSPRADRVTLIRRLYLDMHGLLPTPEQVARFVSDPRADAYARLVERVLASPRYGERWARHWLDVVRFAETDGFEMNQERPTAWHYRDWVIDAFNSDKPYDRFVLEQLAGDAVGADAATGFLVGGPYDKVKSPDVKLTLMQRQDELADIVNTTGTAFLGITVGCARCHNHKFDPVLQTDYYSLQAVFAGVQHGERPVRTPEDGDRERRLAEVERRIAAAEAALAELGVRPAVDARRNEERFAATPARYVRFVVQATNNGIEPCLDELEIWSAAGEGGEPANVGLASAGAKATSSGDYAGDPKHQLEHVHDGRYGNGRSWISNQRGAGWVQLELAEETSIDRIVWGRDREGKYADRLPTRYHIDVATEPGAWHSVASSEGRLPVGDNPNAAPAAAAEDDQKAAQITDLVEELSALRSQRRNLASGAVNVYAGRFVQPGATHRLYRGDPMQKREPLAPGALAVLGTLGLRQDAAEQKRRVALARWMTGPDNPLTARVIANRVWHYHFGTGIVDTPSDLGANGTPPSHPKLLDWLASELISGGWSLKHLHRVILTSSAYRQRSAPRARELAADAGSRLLWRFPPRRLEAEAIRDCMLQLSGALRHAGGGPGFSVFEPNSNYVRNYVPKTKFGPAEWRRSIYMTKVRMEQDAVFGAFDCPDAGQVAPRRSRSTTAIQALNLLNSPFVAEQSELFARRLAREAGEEPAAQVRRAFRLAFSREPDVAEAEAAGHLIREHGLPALCRALLNANELLFVP